MAGEAGEGRTFTEAEHAALLTDAVQRETAELRAANEQLQSENTDLTARVDVLEAEKATLTTERDTVRQELADYREQIEQEKAIEAAKKSRLETVKAANENLPEEYFTDERVQNWAEMPEKAFEDLVEAIKLAPAGVGSVETAAFAGGETPPAPESKPATTAFLAARRGALKKGE